MNRKFLVPALALTLLALAQLLIAQAANPAGKASGARAPGAAGSTPSAAATATAATAGNPDAGRVALVIGNGRYATVPRLDNPPNDAADMADKLKSLGFSVTTLVNASLADMEKARVKFAEDAKGASMRVFFYAGHGVQSDGTNWLIPVDADVREEYELKLKAFSAQAVLDGLRAAGTGTNVVILDACRDNPYKASSRSAGASRGLAAMGTSGSLIVFATGPGSTAADGQGRNGVFTAALLQRLDSPGVSLQEIMTNVAADVVGATAGKQEPWKQDNLTKMVYFVSPDEARARFASNQAKAQGELDAANAQLASLRRQASAEGDAAKKTALEVEIKKQAALQNQKQQEAEALKAEAGRQAQAEKDQAAMAAQLASYKSEALGREASIKAAAEARRQELLKLQAGSGAGGVSTFLATLSTTRSAMSDINGQYAASLKTISDAVGSTYDKKLSELAKWEMDPWENKREFDARVSAERNRLNSEKQAALADAKNRSDDARLAALKPFLDAENTASGGIATARSVYKGNSVLLTVGTFDRDAKTFSLVLQSKVQDFAFSASGIYSVAGESTEELKRRYLEFDAWQKAGALFGEIEASYASAGQGAVVAILELWRVRAVDAAGDHVIFEEASRRPLFLVSGDAKGATTTTLTSSLLVEAPGAAIAVDGIALGRDRGFLANPRPGNHTITATLPNGKQLSKALSLAPKSHEQLAVATTGNVTVSTKTEGDLFASGVFVAHLPSGGSCDLTEQWAGPLPLELRHEGDRNESLRVEVAAGATTSAPFTWYDTSPMVRVKGGSFAMGSTEGSDEKPVHTVTVSDFSIGRYEVTQALWQSVMGSNPSNFKGDDRPVEQVSWFDAVDFCNKLSATEGLKPAYSINGSNVSWDRTAKGYRLPTEAEWEYAARGGSQGSSQKVKYAGSDNPDAVAWYSSNEGSQTHPVGHKQANALGLYDMAGNVWEWVWDWYDSGYYAKSRASDPVGADSGSSRVLRGGSWGVLPVDLRSSSRSSYGPSLGDRNFVGFRVVR